MGFLDKMKGAVQAVTGGAADVSIEFPTQGAKIGDSIPVKVVVMSTGGEVKSGGVFVDIVAREEGEVFGHTRCESCGHMDDRGKIRLSKTTVEQSVPIAPAFVLGAGERKEFEGNISIPHGQPTYRGGIKHEWSLRGRLEAFGNDPDSGYKTIEIK